MSTLRRLLEAFHAGFFPARHLRKQLAATRQSLVRDIRDGTRASVTGMARPFETRLLEAPLSKRLCVHYSVTLWATQTLLRDEAGQKTHELATETERVPFWLEDSSGRAIVDLRHAAVIGASEYLVSAPLTELDRATRNLLERLQLTDRLELTDRSWTRFPYLFCREKMIEPDAQLSIAGLATGELDPDERSEREFRAGPPRRFRFAGTSAHPVIVKGER